ncbi:MAG: Do family serine endopeptidase [Hyphomicrobium sp.]
MQSSRSTLNSANTGPKSLSRRSARLGLSAAALAGGLLAAGPVLLAGPAYAQLKAADSVETAFGRAPLTFADIIQKVKPSVVSVSVVSGGSKVASKEGGNEKGKGKGTRRLPEGMPDIPEDSPLYDFFFKNMPKGNQPDERPSQAQGSGFVISTDGYIVTNNHVVEGANKIQVSFDNQEKFDADLIGTDPRTDLALLKIQSSRTFPAVALSTSVPRVGDWALAVGNPFGLGGTVTAGIVSALARDINPGPYEFIQIDAAVNKGNSGGPTFNLSGEVMGVNTAIFSPSGGNVGIAFAIPARTVNDVVEQLKKSGSVSRGWLGVKIQNVDEDTSAALGLPDSKGALVSEITADGPAAGSGLKVQDTILQVNADKINDSKDLARKIADLRPDAMVELKVWRGGAEQSVKVKLGKFPGSAEEIAKLEQGQAPGDDTDEGVEVDKLGMKLAPSKTSGGSEGVTIADVANNSDAAEKGLKAGDIILQVDGAPVSTPEEVVESVNKIAGNGKKAVMLYVKTAEQKRIVPLRFGKKG